MGPATALHAITSWEEVPVFEGEASEAAFWAAHSVDIRLMGIRWSLTNPLIGDHPLRMDPKMLSRIKRLARSRYLVSKAIKQWLENIDQEMAEKGS